MSKHKVFLIVGRTASGKTSLAKEASKKLNLKLLKSYITRPMRNGEIADADHTFIEPDKVDLYKDRMIAYTDKIDQYVRFATIDQLLDSDLYIIDPSGIDYLRTCKFKELKDIELIEIYIRVPYTKAIHYALKRGDSLDAFQQRYDSESKQFSYYEHHQQLKYHILNDGDFNDTYNKLENIIKKELGYDTGTSE